jgi:4a-hydroxytetrahydrobiopterin dehydratase
MSEALADKACIPCQGGVPPLKEHEYGELLSQLDDEWKVVAVHHLERSFSFENFKDALAFTNAVGEIAEQQAHHPDIYLAWGKVKVCIWTHKIDGLTASDFFFAAKCDRAFGT